MTNKAICPVCNREITVDEGRYLRRHNRLKRYRKGQEPDVCAGSGRQPADQQAIPAP